MISKKIEIEKKLKSLNSDRNYQISDRKYGFFDRHLSKKKNQKSIKNHHSIQRKGNQFGTDSNAVKVQKIDSTSEQLGKYYHSIEYREIKSIILLISI